MNTILEEIFKNEDYNSKINNVNTSFFNKYLNKDIILKLIDIRMLYLEIFTFEKNKSKEEREHYIIKNELDKLLKYKENIVSKNDELISKKNILINSFNDGISVKKLELDIKLNEVVIKNLKVIKEIDSKIEIKTKEYEALSFSSYDRDMLISTLKYKLNDIKDFKEFDNLYDYKDLYEDEISKIIENDMARKCYVTYLFLSITEDLDNLVHIRDNASLLAFHTFKNERKIALENTSINLEYSIVKSIYKSLNEYVDIFNRTITNNKMNEISKEMLKHITIINTMIHFAKNHSSLSDDSDIKTKEFNIIKDFINDLKLDLKNNLDKDMKKVISNTINTFNSFTDNL